MKLRPALVAVALATGSLLAVTPPVQAVDGTSLAMTSLIDLQVDAAYGRVFVSGDGGELVTTDLDGNAVSNPLTTGVGEIARTPDGADLVMTRKSAPFVADGRISVFNTATLTITKTVTLPAGCTTGDLAPASGLVFFFYRCDSDNVWKIGSVDLATSTFALDLLTSPMNSGKLLSVPGAPAMLVASFNGLTAVYDTTGGATPSVTLRTSRATRDGDVALSPDGTEVVMTGMDVDAVSAFSTTDLAEVGEYYMPGSADLVAIRGDGVVASGLYGSLRFFQPGTFDASQVRSVSTSRSLTNGAMAFGSKRVYYAARVDTTFRLFVDTPGPPAGLRISAARTLYSYGAVPTVVVQITSPTTSRKVNLYATPANGSAKLLKTVTVDAASREVTTTVGKITVNTTYTAEFTGDDDFAASRATTSVKALARITISTPSRSLSSYFHKVPASPAQKLTVSTLPTANNGCLTLVYERYSAGIWRGQATLRCVHRSPTGTYQLLLGYQHPGDRVRVAASLTRSLTNASSYTNWYYIVFT